MNSVSNQSVPQVTISLPLPPILPFPKAILRAPSRHTTCIPLVLDASASMDSQGLLSIGWACNSGCNDEIQELLNEADAAVVTLPARVLEKGLTLLIRLDVTNSWGVTSSTSATVAIIDANALYVDISGGERAVLLSEYVVPVIASVNVLRCDGSLASFPEGNQEDIYLEWRLLTCNGGLITDVLGPVFIIEPGQLAKYLSEVEPLNLTLKVSSSGYVDAYNFVSVSKARVLSVPSSLQIQPIGARLSLNESVSFTAVAFPKALFRRKTPHILVPGAVLW